VPLGIAFQIQDDILGVFGSRKKIGKSVASDIEEGKISLLVVKARQSATANQKKKLNSILGKENLTNKEIKDFQNILRSTGALKYCQNFASELIREAKMEIEKVIIKKDSKNFLIALAEYLEKREI
jgi:geranylgeranyl diphosphate synthase type I